MAVVLAASACGAAAAGAQPSVMEVRARDFAFQAPREIPAGTTTIRLHNDGPDLHHVQLLRLDEGHTLEELMAGMGEQGPPPPWVHFVGGPNTPAPGEHAETTVDLHPGQYLMVCVIPGPDGVPHIAKGMLMPLTVTAAAGGPRPHAAADVHMSLIDYNFVLDRDITAGRRTIHVVTNADQPHEVLIAQLAPGKTLQDLMAWVAQPSGPPPARPIGGTTSLERGVVNVVTADFAPGEYALVCFHPDARDGQPHHMHGMMRQITVR
ncbi:MAG TPA: hypothetical protein VHG08_12630 [Longimicrobium sp.]|nr:hypothetical protein [Longimicrobium sp.]